MECDLQHCSDWVGNGCEDNENYMLQLTAELASVIFTRVTCDLIL